MTGPSDTAECACCRTWREAVTALASRWEAEAASFDSDYANTADPEWLHRAKELRLSAKTLRELLDGGAGQPGTEGA